MKLTNTLLGIIAILLAVNCYLTYRSGLEYGIMPLSQRTDAEFASCLDSTSKGSTYGCPHGWYLKGSK